MSRRPKGANLMAALALALAGGVTPPRGPSRCKPAKPVFSAEEKAHLATLEGKEKRDYVRELQEKYRS